VLIFHVLGVGPDLRRYVYVLIRCSTGGPAKTALEGNGHNPSRKCISNLSGLSRGGPNDPIYPPLFACEQSREVEEL
jgi:hypothetical protein